MILTTSRRCCAKSRQLCKELQCVIPLSSYVVRGRKGMRELISLSVEKGADRLLIVTSQGNNPASLLFYNEWEYLGALNISVILRRELSIPKLSPLSEDVPFLLSSPEEDSNLIAYLFGADIYDGNEAYTYMRYREEWIDFFRLDVSDTFVGPRLKVEP